MWDKGRGLLENPALGRRARSLTRWLSSRAEDILPQVTWGTSPEMVVTVADRVPIPAQEADPVKKSGIERALSYMGLTAITPR